jgi:ADP-L-glycero-D-manno-heptose 6-epimerase
MTYYVVTGAAGFIGSRLVAALNRRGITEVIAVDNLEHADKFRNLARCEIADYLDQGELFDALGELDVEAVFHQGANSNTMATDGREMMENNYGYSKRLLAWCQEEEVPFIYASSAAVYGAGREFKEERRCEQPLNVYGYSKFLFDQHVRRILSNSSAQVAGLRYFNVYGPNEAHKGRMASVAFHAFNQLRAEGKVKLFVGGDGYADGAQQRDFVHVDDCVAVNLWLLERRHVSGIFNCGSGRAQTFNDVAATVINTVRGTRATAQALAQEGLIQYVPFPPQLVGKYQSYTQGDLARLRAAGYAGKFMSVEEGVASYVKDLLGK